MEKITTSTELKAAISLLRVRREIEKIALKKQFDESMQALRPINLVKHTLKELSTAPEFKNDLINASISIGVGYLSKKAIIGNSSNPIKQLLGTFLQMAVTKIVATNSDKIRAASFGLIHTLLSKKEGTG